VVVQFTDKSLAMEVGLVRLVWEQHLSKSSFCDVYIIIVVITVNHITVCVIFSTNYLMPLSEDMISLRNQVYSILLQYKYLAPFVKEFNHIQFSINGNKGLLPQKSCSYVQTGMHCDISYTFHKTEGIRCLPSTNSQEVNSIVAIITIGHSRIITFERVVWNDGPTDDVLERRHLILSHGSLFIVHPLDERPALRDVDSHVLSYWRHGDVRMVCNNPTCTVKCHNSCHTANEYTCSFTLAFRRCIHDRIIDSQTNTDPLLDADRTLLGLSPLGANNKDRNDRASKLLHDYKSNGGDDNFRRWLLFATQKVMADFYK
jgi:hypothetical protein